jgi:hypothetical protein
VRRALALVPLLALAACSTDLPPPQPCTPTPARCWHVQLDPTSGKFTRVCADDDSDAQPAGWWRE